jgi:flagellar motor switch protein FliN/FliY
MAGLSAEIVAEVVESCKAGAERAAAAFGQALDAEVQVSVGEPGKIDTEALPEGLDGPGLAILLTVGSSGALVLVPESSGLLPPRYADPDPDGQGKLASLAREVGVALFPETHTPDSSKAFGIPKISEALTRGGLASGAAMVPLELETADGTRATVRLVWPVANPAALVGEEGDEPQPETQPEEASDTEPGEELSQPIERTQPPARKLPQYTRSLLRIRLPVTVTLARKPQPLGRILELAPGSIIQFDKSCEEMLELDVGGLSIATGEAVKVGDKFGLRVNSMILPHERFRRVEKKGNGRNVAERG